MQHFASQLRSEQQTTHSVRASHYRRKRAAKSDPADVEASSASPEPQGKSSSRQQSHQQSHASSFASAEIAQLRLAGLLPEDDDQVPAAPFPHAPARAARAHYGHAKAHEDMAKLPVPLYAVHNESDTRYIQGQRTATALKKTHLDVVSTLMHTCLLRGDYIRAGRAWGLILRTQVAGGHPVDPRNNGRWGIGAEILLHREPQTASMQGNHVLDASRVSGDDIFSDEGFELAREYYERLIVQYPHRRFAPTATDERTFYPAMFSLWIFEVCEKSKRARATLRDRPAEPPGMYRSASIDSISGPDDEDTNAKEEAIRVKELAHALEIAERLDRLVVSPPFDKQVSLLQLRGHVSLWLSDLIIGKMTFDEDWDMDSSFEDSIDQSNLPKEGHNRLINAQRELLQAQGFFTRAEALGARGQTATTSSINIRLREVARRLKEPHG
ncbi:hypothetical protein T440DRAFT_91075 [Plenodomus tracheiphilus IPT5]|uniref:Uncharacterized protein n=1 Tax=Plenodomus tracheiphilus IPT5 TaxID=1408161 RepID=A0A6A7B5C9_9PLEO|nr:hypothetical protein T440DRAFT_91075 [Plenodomus tracheiphilus IPT5]